MFPKIHGNYAVFGQKPFPNLSFLSAAFLFFLFLFYFLKSFQVSVGFLMNDLLKERFY